MQLRMWMYDLAREQTPTFETLDRLCRLSLESGYNALGLYLEHRFAYPSFPWAAGKDAVTPEMIRDLERRYPNLQLVPFINVLGHMEGIIYAEEGVQYACERFKGMQAEPTDPAVFELAERLIHDTIAAFSSDLIQIGGDETFQLGHGPRSAAAVREFEAAGATDGKAELYGRHFGRLSELVIAAGRTPGVWGDMFYDHPTALAHLPKSTVIFDWQYFRTAEYTAQRFRDAGYPVVLCPSIQTYSATWCQLAQSERNVTENAASAERCGDLGVCVTTWEGGLFGNYETLLPAIKASGGILANPPDVHPDPVTATWPTTGLGGEEATDIYAKATDAPHFLRAYLELGENGEEWARLMGIELQTAGGIFAYSGHRSQIKSRMLLYSNPFLLWLRHREDILGEPGDRAFEILDRALYFAPDSAYRGVSEVGKLAIEFVRFTEAARQAYAAGHPGRATTELAVTRQIFENLEKIAKSNHLRFGGSLADIERCIIAREHVERVIRRVKQYGDRSLGYLPSFETLTHPKFVPHDQANWWLINDWGNE